MFSLKVIRNTILYLLILVRNLARYYATSSNSVSNVFFYYLFLYVPKTSIFYIILAEFLTKEVLECTVNPAYFIGCCDCALISLFLKTIVLIFNATHKTGCCEYWDCSRWHNLWSMISHESLNYPFLVKQFIVGII